MITGQFFLRGLSCLLLIAVSAFAVAAQPLELDPPTYEELVAPADEGSEVGSDDMGENGTSGEACPTCGCSCGGCCCGMKEVCYCTTEKETVEKSCWKVGCEKVCIPPICLPRCCTCLPLGFCRSCADCRVRCVRTLEEHKYECEECNCKWEVKCVPVCGCRCGAGCAGGTGRDCGCESGCGDTYCAEATPAVPRVTVVTTFTAPATPTNQPATDTVAVEDGPVETIAVAFDDLPRPEDNDETSADATTRKKRTSWLSSWARGGIFSNRETETD